ncbi:tape measure protein [Halomonas caseinilytica]|uniref:tape measure protein n=1 Tax=Halomonas caseinilytica TaxID=438744 RepID=UPI0007E593E2|nr:tape measure protein [Halomonas caseinilytica]SEN16554.1 tape measure domain-containing protein [Halomonas caseinilytica]
MSESVGSIYYTVDAQTQRLLQAERQVDRSTRRMEQGFDRTDDSVNNLNDSLGQLKTLVTAVASAMAVQQVVRYSDAWTSVQNRLRIVTDGHAELEHVTERLMRVANESRASIGATAELYSRLWRSTRTLGTSQEELIKLTDTINKGFAASGASAQEAENAIRQLSQGLASGALRGEEFNAVSEQAPIIMRAVMQETGKARGELRDFAAEGGITSDLLIRAVQNFSGTINDEFGQTMATFSQNWVKAANNLTQFIGESGAVTTVVRESGEALVILSDNIDAVAQVAAMAASVVGGRLLQSIQATTAEYVKKAAANLADAKAEATAAQQVVRRTAAERTAAMALLASAKTEEQATRGTSAHAFALQQLSVARVRATEAAGAHTAATNAATAAMSRATVAARGMAAASRMAKGALALIGGPMGVAVIAAAGLAMYHDELDEMLAPSRRAEKAVDDLTESIDRNSRAALENGIAKYKAQLADLETQAEDARTEIDKINDENNTPGPFRKSMVMGPGADERRAEYEKLDELGVQIQARKDGIESLQESLDNLGDAGGSGSGDGDGNGGGGGGGSSDAAKKARKRFEALKKQLETERETIEREYRERNALIRRFTEEGSQEQVRLLKRSSKERREALKGISEEYQGLIDELYPVRAAQRQFREEMERLELARQIGLIDDLSDAQKRLRKSMRSDESWQDAYGFSPDDTKQLDKTNDAARELGMTFTSAFEDAIVEGEGFREVLQGIAEDIQRLMIRKSITEPATDALSGALDGFDWGGLFSFGGGGSYGGSGWAGSVVTAASGGYVSGPGTSTSDSIPARLSDGEFVVNAQATSRPGVRPMLEALNSNRAYAKGGFVGGGSSGSGGLGGVVVNVHTDSGSQVTRQESQGQGGTRQIDLYIERKVRSTVHGMFSSGEMDRPMRRFGARRQST